MSPRILTPDVLKSNTRGIGTIPTGLDQKEKVSKSLQVPVEYEINKSVDLIEISKKLHEEIKSVGKLNEMLLKIKCENLDIDATYEQLENSIKEYSKFYEAIKTKISDTTKSGRGQTILEKNFLKYTEEIQEMKNKKERSPHADKRQDREMEQFNASKDSPISTQSNPKGRKIARDNIN